jgi:UDP-N-acetylmuramyl pentapeptide synthase
MITKLSSRALEFILKHKVRRLFKLHHPVVIAVTGTVGKTSTKVIIGRSLSKIYQDKKISYSTDSYNSPIGMPLGIFNLKAPERLTDIRAWINIFKEIDTRIKNFDTDILVLEVAEDEPEYMPAFMGLINPDIMVVTALSLAHAARTISKNNIFDNINKLTKYAQYIIKNNDFDLLKNKLLGDGFSLSAKTGPWTVHKIVRELDHSLTLYVHSNEHNLDLSIPTSIIGQHNLYPILATLMVMDRLGSGPDDYLALGSMKEELRPMNGRMNLLKGISGSSIIDDSYNAASPIGVFAALDTLTSLPAKRKIALFGNMNELGDKSKDEHIKVAEYVMDKADIIIFLGPDMSKYGFDRVKQLVGKAGLEEKVIIKKFDNPYMAGEYLKDVIEDGDLVLVKGSQNNVFSEEAIKYILSHDLDPQNVLVRQGGFWDTKKRASFS